ncbi:LytTR family transcriptional regulator DNA-binding domain-containing protein [Ichthyenterobacterium sp. W332]|uniref:LytTR family transcriptional regulator DNA-binding domain-containing protein n=1 Tax=Microcosmobacter mediterraneus TaxID=3075607 RepID=A0ABU2YII8_9FLAO|nr:LytTR family transcriptional regulator DNA-binding domain-containing protein [Ichthyenterobacterium sp. W332]MDT0557989.1 LytTR family transcriptional regulator DNA-binding domain-containing protein [Ichthyenterobacterium sp. W332]
MKLLKFIFLLFITFGSNAQNISIDSTLQIAQSFYQTNIDSAVHYAGLAYDKAIKEVDTQKIAKAIGYKSTFFLSQKKNKQAVTLLQFNVDNASKLKPEDLGVTYNNLGVINSLVEDEDEALEYYFKALESFEIINHYRQLSRVNLNIGIVFRNKEMMDQADYFFDQSLYYSKLSKDKNIENIHKGLDDNKRSSYKKNIEAALKALGSIENKQKSRLASIIYHDLSENYLNKGDFNLAIKAANSAIDSKINSRFIQNLDYTYYILGKAQINAKIYLEGIETLKKAINLTNKEELKIEMYDSLIEGYKNLKQYNEALNYALVRNRFSDSIDRITEKGNIAKITANFRNEKQEKELIQLKQLNQEQELLISKKENKIWRWSIAALIATLVSIWLWRRFLNSQKRIKQVEFEKDEISRKVEQLALVLNNKTKVYLDNLKFIKSDGNYLEFVTDEKTVIDRNKLKVILEELPPNFVRVHRSYVVNKNFIDSLNSTTLFLQSNIEIPLSRTFKSNLV